MDIRGRDQKFQTSLEFFLAPFQVALVMGGRHPGHYYLSSGEHNDFVMRRDVCMVSAELR